MKLSHFLSAIGLMACVGNTVSTDVMAQTTVTWDRLSLMMDGHRVVPVMAEIHYSRVPVAEWQREVQKMKDGGVTIIATYVFWNHIEEQQGIFNWSGQRNLRHFLEVCKAEGMPVVLRVGPYCHGEVRCGGIPDWVVASGCKLRSEDPLFLSYTELLYRQIFSQVQGLQWKDGGPVVACQFDNEFGGDGSYLMALKGMAQRIGFDLPFYTRTGWPEMRTPTPFGEMIPLYGDYADGFWDRSTREGAGNYWKAFHFKAFRSSTAIASEQMPDQKESVTKGDNEYPYFTCELGGGMMPSYHRRVYLYPEDAYSMALVKLGSGSNLLGYYMYHGGTNPEGTLTYLNENQRTPFTRHNDLPVKTYDFQAPLGEFGQRNPHYYSLRPLHLFMHDFGEQLAPMEAVFPDTAQARKHDDSHLRWTYREGSCNEAFVFVNNYERFANLTAKSGAQFSVCGVTFPRKPIMIPAGMMAIFPVNMHIGNNVLDYATAQPVAQRDGKIWFERKAGIAAEFSINGKVRTVGKTSTTKPFMRLDGTELYLISTEEAGRLFLAEAPAPAYAPQSLTITKVKEAAEQRKITIGFMKVAEEPVDEDFEAAAVYSIVLPTDSTIRATGLMSIDYSGDVARLYANGKLIDDNFYNGRPFLYGLWRLPADVKELELRILPLQPDMPVYFPREADRSVPETVRSVTVEARED